METEFTLERGLDGALETALAVGWSAPNRDGPSASTYPGKEVPRSWVSMKNWVSKISGVESKGVRGMVVSTLSAAATVWAERSQTTSKSWKPTSSKRAKMESTVSGLKKSEIASNFYVSDVYAPNGSGTSPSGAG